MPLVNLKKEQSPLTDSEIASRVNVFLESLAQDGVFVDSIDASWLVHYQMQQPDCVVLTNTSIKRQVIS